MAIKALPCPTRARLFVKYNPETGDMIWNARARHKNGRSRFKGVAWNGKYKRWTAQINLHGRRWHLGTFRDETEAALAYNKAATEIHGEFARINEV